MIFRILEDQIGAKLKAAKQVDVGPSPLEIADARFMQLALQMGRRGLGRTFPNPAVGAVVVKDGIIVGRGWTQPGGRPHAEVEALRRAGAAARGATLYVTLEPCSHVGKSPPCTDAVIAAGIARVVSAIEDPNPAVAGQGHARLRAAGIDVSVGQGAAEAAHDHAGHFRRVRDGRPHIILKLAVSQDERIGGAGRTPLAITGEAVRSRVHLLRAQCDAILTGIGTAQADDPELTSRLPGLLSQSPIRVVLDRSLRLDSNSKLLKGARQTPLWVMASPLAEAATATKLGAAGARILHVADNAATAGLDLSAVARKLAEQGITRLLVEGGARVAAGFLKAGLVDEAWLFRSDQVVGPEGVAALEGMPLIALTQSPDLEVHASEVIGPDRLTIYTRRA